MSDMRLIVAGAAPDGRALTRVIAETPAPVLTGALEAPGSELLGKDAGVLAACRQMGSCSRRICGRCRPTPTAFSTSPYPARPLPMSRSAAEAEPGSRHRHRSIRVG